MSRYVAEAIGLLAALAPTLEQAITVAAGKAFVILDGTLLRIDRVGMGSGYDRAFYSGKHKCHGVNVQVIADPVGRLVWISPPLPGVRHDMGAARIHGIIDAVNAAGVRAVADTAYQGGGPAITVPHRRRRRDLDTGRYRPLPANQKAVNAAHARRRAPGERVNAELKNWKNLRTIRSSPSQAGQLIAAAPPHDRSYLNSTTGWERLSFKQSDSKPSVWAASAMACVAGAGLARARVHVGDMVRRQ
ncbi:transposase family protein [Pseudonocardia sp. ICBG1142]|uniref:transposase family protein n=1 Tax=Pseudonocardia sp. ICBG1142 TaxID=2846760 RepID=UPI0035A98EEB